MDGIAAPNFENHKLIEDRQVFRGLCESLADLIRAHDIECTPYLDRELPSFSSLSVDDRAAAIGSIADYFKLCLQVMADGGSLNSSSTFAWRAVREGGLIPPSDLFSKILDTDLVEIYDLNNIQRFRNLKFFQFCSYTLEDLYTRPWHKLFVRHDEGVTNEIIKLITSLIANRDKRIVKTGFGTQTIEEVDSIRHYFNELDVKYLGVLYDRRDQPAAFIGIESARRLPST